MDVRNIPEASWPSDWHDLPIDRKKRMLEDRLGEILGAMASAGHDPTEWQRANLRDAMTCIMCGLYGMALHDMDNALETDISPRPWGNPATKPKDLQTLTLDRLIEGLSWLRRQPAQAQPVFMLRTVGA